MVSGSMRRLPRIVAFLLLFLFVVASLVRVSAEKPLPKPAGPVNDFADLITPPYEKRIGNLAKELFDKTGVALVVVTMHDLGGDDHNEYATRLYNAWGIGKKGEDKGVLILVIVRQRKMRIETGAGLKAFLTESLVQEIQDRFMAPFLKQNNYDDGLLNGVVAIGKIISKQAGVTINADASPKAVQEGRSGFPIGVAVLVLGAAILAFVLYKIYGRSKAKANLGNIQK
jgi:uncharacterized protein